MPMEAILASSRGKSFGAECGVGVVVVAVVVVELRCRFHGSSSLTGREDVSKSFAPMWEGKGFFIGRFMMLRSLTIG